MPTPRQHGGTIVAQFPLVVPGFKGLNTEAKGAVLGPEWATTLENSVLDTNGRVAARKGWSAVTSSAYGAAFVSGIEYRKKDSTVHIVCTTATQVAASTDAGVSFSNVTGTASFTSGIWHLVNFNDFVIGFQSGKKPLIYNGTTSSHVADSSAPQSGIGTAAFGRVWSFAADGTTLRYSALLDHTNWSTGTAGTFDLSNVWPDNDTGTAIAAYNNVLVIFGKRNILIMADGTGSTIGLNPTTAQIVDTIPGIGCATQASVQKVGGDLWFLAQTYDLMSLERVLLEQKSGNLTNLTRNITGTLVNSFNNGSFVLADLRSAYSPKDRLYLLSLPSVSSSTEVGKVFAFDTKQTLENGSARCVGIWNQLVPTVLVVTAANTLLLAIRSVTGKLGLYTGNRDNGSTYRLVYASGWLDLTEQGFLLILKRLTGTFYFNAEADAFLKWAFDFDSTWITRRISFADTGTTASEWGVSEWGIATWGAGVALGNKRVGGSGTGQFIRVGCDVIIDGGDFAFQQLTLLAKIGRLAG